MKCLISRLLVLTAALAAVGTSASAEDLDRALEAQKKKAVRRVYSERALLEDRDLTVPHSQTEEEKLLDKKLREMEAKADARPWPKFVPVETGPAMTGPRQEENKNWLTAAVLDDLESTNMVTQTEDSWLTQELTRQREIKEKEAMTRENEQVDRLLRERTALPTPDSSSGLDSLKKYQLTPPRLFGSSDYNDNQNAPNYLTPQNGLPDPLAAVRSSPKRDQPAVPALFSPEAARMSSASRLNPLDSTQPATLSLTPAGPPSRKSSSVFSYDRANPDQTPEVLTPLERIRKASPINRPNPFADDHMPEFKTSIWQ